ncbi:MAG TPA: hypothetical protein V6D00_06055 [Pantanalinema sp.]
MKNRQRVTFQQVMIIPALTTLGLGSLLYAQNLSLTTPVNAAPLAAIPGALAATSATTGEITASDGPVQLAAAPARSATSSVVFDGNPEFGAGAALPGERDRIRATTKVDLVRMARENSGREDPFVALINPGPDVIQALPSLPTLRPQTVPIGAAEPSIVLPKRPVKVATRINSEGNREIIIDPPEAGDEPARGPLLVPKWTLSGVLNTGREQIALLENEGNSREARLGEVLEDGSRVVRLESRKVVLMLNGRRFPKTIGGADAAN